MAYRYEVNGHVVEFDQEPNEDDIDQAAATLGPAKPSQQTPTDYGTPFHPKNYPRRDFLQDVNDTAMGAIEGATFGIPRAITEKAAGAAVKHFAPQDTELYNKVTNLPRGNFAGQLAGGIASGSELENLVGKLVPGLAKTAPKLVGNKAVNKLLPRVGRGVATGGIVANTPLVTDVDAPAENRVGNTLIGAGLGGATEAVVPPIVETIGKLLGGKSLPIQQWLKKRLSPPRSFEKNAEDRLWQIGANQKAATENVDNVIGTHLAPEGSEAYRSRIEAANPEALSQLPGISPDDATAIGKLKQKTGRHTIPSTDEAGELYQSVLDDAPDDFQLNVGGFRNDVAKTLRSHGMIDASGKSIPGIGRDNKTLTSLMDIHNDLNYRINQNKKIPGLLNQTEQDILNVSGPGHSKEALERGVMHDTGNLTSEAKKGINNAISHTDKLDMMAYRRTRRNLLSLKNGEPQNDALVGKLIKKFDEDAIGSGLEGLSTAKDTYALAKLGEPADRFLKSPESRSGKSIQSLMKQALNDENASAQLELSQKVGPDVADKLSAQRSELGRQDMRATRAKGRVSHRAETREKLLNKKYVGRKLMKDLMVASAKAKAGRIPGI